MARRRSIDMKVSLIPYYSICIIVNALSDRFISIVSTIDMLFSIKCAGGDRSAAAKQKDTVELVHNNYIRLTVLLPPSPLSLRNK